MLSIFIEQCKQFRLMSGSKTPSWSELFSLLTKFPSAPLSTKPSLQTSAHPTLFLCTWRAELRKYIYHGSRFFCFLGGTEKNSTNTIKSRRAEAGGLFQERPFSSMPEQARCCRLSVPKINKNKIKKDTDIETKNKTTESMK